MKKVMLVVLVAMGLFSLKNVYGSGENDKLREFKQAMENEDIKALDEFLRL
ncbi:hypothetical protein [Sebaldella sp. S0638]|uniref:hypothetical protein n=1 Tax=Sebaldella sp. S0638 TaxID=2957809 RepID=UPI00209E62A3|nr:hypothetical protein [Sebaldella sp. S0638]MCP1226368.1 hypothetical protein [Sebaldella sp. S0638]